MVELLRTLTEANGVSGNENEVREILHEQLKGSVDELKIDRIGNLIAIKKGRKSTKKIMLCAHMDEVGFIISNITDNGMLKFKQVGSIDPRVMVSKRVRIGAKAIPGVLGIKAIHLQEPDERNNAVKLKQMVIDIGVKSKDEAEKLVKPGDYASFDSNMVLFGNRRIKAKALDDRVGCAALIEILKEQYDEDIYACFTVQEEVGLRGAEVAAFHVAPALAVVLEGTTCADVPDVEEYQQITRLGEGPAISFMDQSSVGNKSLFNGLLQTAKECSIPIQLKEGTSGGNDSGKIHVSRVGVPTIVVSVPCRYIHSPSSVMDLRDYENMILLVKAFLKGSGCT